MVARDNEHALEGASSHSGKLANPNEGSFVFVWCAFERDIAADEDCADGPQLGHESTDVLHETGPEGSIGIHARV
jgi:hypothetical protein